MEALENARESFASLSSDNGKNTLSGRPVVATPSEGIMRAVEAANSSFDASSTSDTTTPLDTILFPPISPANIVDEAQPSANAIEGNKDMPSSNAPNADVEEETMPSTLSRSNSNTNIDLPDATEIGRRVSFSAAPSETISEPVSINADEATSTQSTYMPIPSGDGRCLYQEPHTIELTSHHGAMHLLDGLARTIPFMAEPIKHFNQRLLEAFNKWKGVRTIGLIDGEQTQTVPNQDFITLLNGKPTHFQVGDEGVVYQSDSVPAARWRSRQLKYTQEMYSVHGQTFVNQEKYKQEMKELYDTVHQEDPTYWESKGVKNAEQLADFALNFHVVGSRLGGAKNSTFYDQLQETFGVDDPNVALDQLKKTIDNLEDYARSSLTFGKHLGAGISAYISGLPGVPGLEHYVGLTSFIEGKLYGGRHHEIIFKKDNDKLFVSFRDIDDLSGSLVISPLTAVNASPIPTEGSHGTTHIYGDEHSLIPAEKDEALKGVGFIRGQTFARIKGTNYTSKQFGFEVTDLERFFRQLMEQILESLFKRVSLKCRQQQKKVLIEPVNWLLRLKQDYTQWEASGLVYAAVPTPKQL